MPPVILFDFFGVICWRIGGSVVNLHSRADADWTFLGDLEKGLDLGKYSRSDFSVKLAEQLHVATGQIQKEVASFEHLNNDVVEIAKELKKVRTVAIASNANADWLLSITDRYDVTDLFDPKIISSQVGVRKPDLAFFHKAVEILKT